MGQSGIKSKAKSLSQPSPAHTNRQAHMHADKHYQAQGHYFSELYIKRWCVSTTMMSSNLSPFCVWFCHSASLDTQCRWDNLNCNMIHKLIRITAGNLYLSFLEQLLWEAESRVAKGAAWACYPRVPCCRCCRSATASGFSEARCPSDSHLQTATSAYEGMAPADLKSSVRT